jgi:CelD/BcsL family acetyltransferase involved in cellulose biosynthesis
MQVVRFCNFETLTPLAAEWDRLAGDSPFCSWAWSHGWWRHFGQSARPPSELYILGVFDPPGRLTGIAPWHLETSAARGRVLRFLGSGEVCSEYLSLLCAAGQEAAVTGAVADWLTAAAHADPLPGLRSDRWDLLELTSIDAVDGVIGRLAADLQARGNSVHRQPGARCWRVELPDTWEQLLARFSRPRRVRLRRMAKLIDGRARIHVVESPDDLPRAEEVLIDLHQRRRRQLGQPGIFSSPRLAAFHRETLREMLASGRLWLSWTELDGSPAAAEYALVGGGRVYAYQSGMDPSRQHESPGHMSNVATVRMAIERGYRTFDFLRGDEPYKAAWGAQPHGVVEIRALPARTSAQWRYRFWLAGKGLKRWIRQLGKFSGGRQTGDAAAGVAGGQQRRAEC